MEIGDVFVINKSDREGVLRTEKELEALLSLAHRYDFWHPPIVKTVATENKGIDELSEAIKAYSEFQMQGEKSLKRRTAIAKWRLLELLREKLLKNVLEKEGTDEKLDAFALEVAKKKRDPYSAIEELLK